MTFCPSILSSLAPLQTHIPFSLESSSSGRRFDIQLQPFPFSFYLSLTHSFFLSLSLFLILSLTLSYSLSNSLILSLSLFSSLFYSPQSDLQMILLIEWTL